jgi:hypothetical protein
MYNGSSTKEAVGRDVFDLIGQLFEREWKRTDETGVEFSALIIDQNYWPTRKNMVSAVRCSKSADRIILFNGVGDRSGRLNS